MLRSFWSLPLLRVFGIRVRADLFLVAYVTAELLRAWVLQVMGKATLPVATVAGAMGILLVSILLHELGHCFAARRLGGEAEEVVLWPLGGLATLRVPNTPHAQFWTAFWGPAVNLLLALGLGAWISHEGSPWALRDLLSWQPSWAMNAFRVNLGLLLFNLLPAFPMDGGQMLRASLWERLGFGQATLLSVKVGKVAAVLLGIVGLALQAWMLFLIAVLNFLSCEQERLLLVSGAIGEDAGFPPPGGEGPEIPRRMGWLERRRHARQEREVRDRIAREARLRSEVDLILDKINRVGMQGLTEGERVTLKEASHVFKHNRK
jgi:Zn-dependent protease